VAGNYPIFLKFLKTFSQSGRSFGNESLIIRMERRRGNHWFFS